LYTPQRLFGEVGSSTDILNHEPFLERARLQREREEDGSARLALGAYVVARLIDKLLLLDGQSETVDGFRWQLEAVRRHVQELPADAPETAHLAGIVAAVPSEGAPTSLLWKNLTAYAYHLEYEGRFDEALEMLALAARAQGPHTAPSDFTSYALGAGRLNRQLARWDHALACYGAAEEAGMQLGDTIAVLRGRLGKGAVHRGRGNYPLARATAEAVVREANELGLTEAQALAYADLGAIYSLLGLPLEALDAEYQAFSLSAETSQQTRALGNLATGLVEIGATDAARLAFQIVAESGASLEVRANAVLELMDVESAAGNRVSFERYRVASELYRSRMPARMSVDYHFKLAMGFSRFGQTGRARASFTVALELAERQRLNDWYFRIEKAMAALSERTPDQLHPAPLSNLSDAEVVRKVESGLREYAAAAGM
jgi:tetratricopeptide (TPR) repeat protein